MTLWLRAHKCTVDEILGMTAKARIFFTLFGCAPKWLLHIQYSRVSIAVQKPRAASGTTQSLELRLNTDMTFLCLLRRRKRRRISGCRQCHKLLEGEDFHPAWSVHNAQWWKAAASIPSDSLTIVPWTLTPVALLLSLWQVAQPQQQANSMAAKWMSASREHLRRHSRRSSIPSQDLETQMSYETRGTCLSWRGMGKCRRRACGRGFGMVGH